tara:strand:- start:8500 stop:9414 length:915 start_codon:yes stop_codon:yes gene_type:complete
MKLFVYDNAKGHVHDETEHYKNTVPLSKRGIEQHFEITKNPNEADYFYMGQIGNDSFRAYSPETFKYFSKHAHKHICDVEGEGGVQIVDWLKDGIITTMGPLKGQNIPRLFTRPTFSTLLVDNVNNNTERFELPDNKTFGFRGYMNCKARGFMVYVLHHIAEIEKDIHINKVWSGPAAIGSDTHKVYVDTMLSNAVSLCPRGSGIDSVRFLESCYYNRVPVIISDLDYHLVGEDHHDMSFCFRLNIQDYNQEKLTKELLEINNTSQEELQFRASKAKEYFDQVIVKYFEDPTAYFLDWLSKQND